jgi:hypothetical protein
MTLLLAFTCVLRAAMAVGTPVEFPGDSAGSLSTLPFVLNLPMSAISL